MFISMYSIGLDIEVPVDNSPVFLISQAVLKVSLYIINYTKFAPLNVWNFATLHVFAMLR